MKGRIYYSDEIKGARGNYGWPVKFDADESYIGITQTADPAIERVLLSPQQVRALVEFVQKYSPRAKILPKAKKKARVK